MDFRHNPDRRPGVFYRSVPPTVRPSHCPLPLNGRPVDTSGKILLFDYRFLSITGLLFDRQL